MDNDIFMSCKLQFNTVVNMNSFENVWFGSARMPRNVMRRCVETERTQIFSSVGKSDCRGNTYNISTVFIIIVHFMIT